MEHGNTWKGNLATQITGRFRAQHLFVNIGQCEACNAIATERHHKDGNTLHNDRSNIMFLCHSCHMVIDGRLENMRRLRSERRQATCDICGKTAKPLRKGRCNACSCYYRLHGYERKVPVLSLP